MGDKIVPLKQAPEKSPLTVVPTDYAGCQHHRYEVHGALPRIFCADCDVDLDPFWVLRRIANDHMQRDYKIEALKRESAKLEKLVKRRLEGRKNPNRAEHDSREIAGLQRTQRADPTAFSGSIVMTAKDLGMPEGGAL